MKRSIDQLRAGLERARLRREAEDAEKVRLFKEAQDRRAAALASRKASMAGRPRPSRAALELSYRTLSPTGCSSTEMDMKVTALVDAGKNLKEIMAETKLSPRQLRHYLYDRLKIRLKTAKRREGLSEEFVRRCIEERRSYNWIAKELGWPYTTVLGRIRAMGYAKKLTTQVRYNTHPEIVQRNVAQIRGVNISVAEAMERLHMTETEAKFAFKYLLKETEQRLPGGTYCKLHQAKNGDRISYNGELFIKTSHYTASLISDPTKIWQINPTARVYLLCPST